MGREGGREGGKERRLSGGVCSPLAMAKGSHGGDLTGGLVVVFVRGRGFALPLS